MFPTPGGFIHSASKAFFYDLSPLFASYCVCDFIVSVKYERVETLREIFDKLRLEF